MDKKLKQSLFLGEPALSQEEIRRVRSSEQEYTEMNVHQLVPGQYQPRRDLSESRILKLSRSIANVGLINQITVRPIDKLIDGMEAYEIICGERRWRAVKLLGWSTIACRVRMLDDLAVASIAMQDNLEREDLNAMEDAFGMINMKRRFELTDETLARQLNISRSKVTNTLRLLELNQEVQDLLLRGEISMGCCRAILSLPQPSQLPVAERAIAENWSVRKVEEYCRFQGLDDLERVYQEEVQSLVEGLKKKTGHAVVGKVKKDGSVTVELTFNDSQGLRKLLDSMRY